MPDTNLVDTPIASLLSPLEKLREGQILSHSSLSLISLLKELVHQQSSLAQQFFENLDIQSTQRLVQCLLNCSGTIFFTGVGKSGLIAKKIAFTLVSTGTKACYLSPLDALHGDVGIVSESDIFIMLSKSGETDELLSLVPAIRNKGATLIGILCNEKSRLAAACHEVMILPFESELCPYNLAPTMSTTFQLLFGDLLAMALMRYKKFSMDQFALNHPAGRIGKRITLKVKDIMLTGSKVPICAPQNPLRSILVELSNKRCGCILIVNEVQKLLGIFTDGDLRRTLQQHGGSALDIPMQEIMSVNPRFIHAHLLAWDAMKLMEADYQRRITVLPVLDEDGIVQGLLHLHDIIQSGL